MYVILQNRDFGGEEVVNHEKIIEVYRYKLYVYAQMMAGRDAPTYGVAKNSCLAGCAAWYYISVTQWIPGIRPANSSAQEAAA